MSGKRLTNEEHFDTATREHPFSSRLLLKVAVGLVFVFTKIYWHWTCTGLVPSKWERNREKGRVIIANHASMLDPAILVVNSVLNGQGIRPLYKADYENNNLVTWLFARVGGIPIHRGTADTKAIRRAVNAIKRGEDVLIFPEGTRIKDPSARPEVHGGYALIAQMAGCDILPVAIDGSERICPNKKGFLRPARVYVHYGDPISFDDVPGESRREKTENMEQVAMETVYAMRTKIRREHGR